MRLKGLAVACASFLAMPLAVAQPAQAAEQCEFWWGVKASYRAYINGPVAKGGWGGAGIAFEGEPRTDGAFLFTPRDAIVEGDTVTIPFDGRLKFNGHNYGGDDLLDMTLSDFRVRATGNQAQILVDYISYESDMADTSARGDRIDGNDVVLANIQLDEAINPGAGSFNLGGRTYLAEEGHKLFLAYDTGEELDTTAGIVQASGCPSANSLDRNTIVGNFSGFNEDIVNELRGWDSKLQSEGYDDSSDSFNNNFEQYQTLVTQSGDSASSSTTRSRGNNIVLPSNTGSASSGGQNSGGAGAAAPGSSGGAEIGECTGRGVTQATATWGVKQSFQSYIRGSIAKGSWTLADGATYGDQVFTFPGAAGGVDGQKGTIQFRGLVSFSGHQGVLDLRIANPEIQFDGNQGTLVATVNSSNMEGTKIDFGRVAVGTLTFSSIDVTDDSASGTAEVYLTDTGADAFANFYEPGIALDPISFTATLGGEAVCDGETAAISQAGSLEEAEAEGETTGYNEENNFQIRSSGAATENEANYIWLVVAGLIIMGASMGRLVIKNPM
ncbi:MAG: HtaA domain-containing protein [Corynebacterium sp.]|nr:HtaA domain-containing protein [Corynebacterium sp.]